MHQSSANQSDAAHSHVHVHTDGRYLRQNNTGGIGIVFKTQGQTKIDEIRRAADVDSSMQAEFIAILHALRRAARSGYENLRIHSDCEAVTELLNEEVETSKRILQKYIKAINGLRDLFDSVYIWHISRDFNERAHRLAFEATEDPSSESIAAL